MPGKYRTLRGRLSPYNNPYKWEILPESKRDEIKTSAKHSSGAGKAEYTNTKQGIHNEASGEGWGCSGSQVEYESTLQGCCKTPHCIQDCINKSALCQTREAMITTCLGLTGLQSSVGVQNWCGTLSTPIKEFGEPRRKESLQQIKWMIRGQANKSCGQRLKAPHQFILRERPRKWDAVSLPHRRRTYKKADDESFSMATGVRKRRIHGEDLRCLLGKPS